MPEDEDPESQAKTLIGSIGVKKADKEAINGCDPHHGNNNTRSL